MQFPSFQKWLTNKERTGTENSSAGCCTILSLDELANAANPGNIENSHGDGGSSMHDSGGLEMVHNPFHSTSTLELALTPPVLYLSGAGVLIGRNIYKDFDSKTSLASKASDMSEAKIKKFTSLVNDDTLSVGANEVVREKLHNYHAYKLYLKEYNQEAKFQKWYAGVGSGAASAGIFIGQFVHPVGIAALFGLTAVGGAHIANAVRLKKEVNAKLKRAVDVKKQAFFLPEKERYIHAQEADIRAKHYRKKLSLLNKNIFSWSLFSAGVGVLGVVQSIHWLSSTILTPAIPIAGLSALGAGIVGTTVYNNMLTQADYYASLPAKFRAQMNTEKHTTLLEVKKRNILANEELTLGEAYQKAFFQHSKVRGSNILARLERRASEILQQALLFATVGLVDKFSKDMKFWNKVRATKNTQVELKEIRMAMFDKLDNVANNILPQPVAHRMNISLAPAKQDDLAMLLERILNSSHRQGIAKLLARRFCEKVSVRDEKTNKKKTVYQVRKQYKKLLAFETYDKRTSLSDDLDSLCKASIFCERDARAERLLSYLHKHCFSDKARNDLVTKNVLAEMLPQVTDQYFAYQVKNQARQSIAVWSGLADTFERTAHLIPLNEKKVNADTQSWVERTTTPLVSQSPQQDEGGCCAADEPEVEVEEDCCVVADAEPMIEEDCCAVDDPEPYHQSKIKKQRSVQFPTERAA